MHLKRMLKKLVLGYKADSESYITFLKRRGAEIGDNVRIFTPAQTYIDTQAPHLLHIGTDVVITGPVTILIHDCSYVRDLTGMMSVLRHLCALFTLAIMCLSDGVQRYSLGL